MRKTLLHIAVARATEPLILFPVIGVLLLAALWAMTFAIIRVTLATAENAAVASSTDLADTYEAQVVRALREIDQTLNLVKFWHERPTGSRSLDELKAAGLLPPDLLFIVSIAGVDGFITDSTRAHSNETVAAKDYFGGQRNGDALLVGEQPAGGSRGAQLLFSRRLNSARGDFAGIVMVSVEAAYFVSGYDQTKLGDHGVLGLMGDDGVFRIRRSGDAVSSGDRLEPASSLSGIDASGAEPRIVVSKVDGVKRWVSERVLYGFPLSVVVGLSVDEELAGARASNAAYVWRSCLGSALIVALMAVWGRMSWQLAQSRLREGEATLQYAQRVEYLALHDGLTGLPNRSMFSKLLGQRVDEAQRSARTVAVAFLDLDRFKQINDSLGHDVGDALLKEVAQRLNACVREGDSVARLGGDEFVVLMPEAGGGKDAAAVAARILQTVGKPFTLIGHEFRVTASIGISVYPHDGLDEQTLTKNADVAMYQAKAEGKNNYRFYSKGMDAHSLERLMLESNLRQALARNEFHLFFQAKREIGSGRITGMEALLRWQHPDLGLLEPQQFMSVAEESGLIIAIGRWVLKAACLQNMAWQRRGLPPLSVAVNLTARQFNNEHLAEDVASIVAATGMDSHLLEIEVSEGMLINNAEHARRILAELKAVGVRIAIDKFGTGYCSLAKLQRFPFDTIKIDRTLVRSISDATDGGVLANAIIAMGRSLSSTVVAQGVETREQADFLRANACDELQGFYFAKPLAADDSTRLLLAQATEITYIGRRLDVNTS